MPKIEILSGKREGEVVEFDDDTVDIGNRKNAKLSIRDPWISWNHAKIIREGGSYVLEDLNSSNGTFINGKKISRQVINPTDEILLGKTKIRFVPEGGASVTVRTDDARADNGIETPTPTMRLPKEGLPTPSSEAPTERLVNLQRENDELRRMKDVLERFLDLTPEERIAAGQAASAGAPAAPAQGPAEDPRVPQLEARVQELEAELAEARSSSSKKKGGEEADAAALAEAEKARQEAVARLIELEGKLMSVEATVVDLEGRLKTSAENAKKELARAKEKLQDDLAAAQTAKADAEKARDEALAKAESLAKKVESAAADANARADKLAKDLESAKKSAIEAEARASKFERDLENSRRATGRFSASGVVGNPELDKALADLAHARAERDEWQRKHDETRAEIDQISMEQIELEDQLRKKIADLEAQLKTKG